MVENNNSMLKEVLNENVVVFTFKKVNGEERQAIGTRAVLTDSEFSSNEHINFTQYDLPKGIKTVNDDIITYWDLDKFEWRSCRVDSIISIDKVITKNDYIK